MYFQLLEPSGVTGSADVLCRGWMEEEASCVSTALQKPGPAVVVLLVGVPVLHGLEISVQWEALGLGEGGETLGIGHYQASTQLLTKHPLP